MNLPGRDGPKPVRIQHSHTSTGQYYSAGAPRRKGVAPAIPEVTPPPPWDRWPAWTDRWTYAPARDSLLTSHECRSVDHLRRRRPGEGGGS